MPKGNGMTTAKKHRTRDKKGNVSEANAVGRIKSLILHRIHPTASGPGIEAGIDTLVWGLHVRKINSTFPQQQHSTTPCYFRHPSHFNLAGV